MSHGLSEYRKGFLGGVILLTCFGLIAVYSASSVLAAQKLGDSLYYFKRQALTAAVGFGFIFIGSYLPIKWLERLTVPVLLGSLGLLCLPLMEPFAHRVNGASRWFRIFGVSLQPAEFAKLAIILFLAKNLSRPRYDVNRFAAGILPNLMIFLPFALLLMLQPDFGSTVVLSTLMFVMIFVAGLPRKHVLWALVAGSTGVVAAVAFAPYRLKRLLSFIDPWADFQRGGFQIIQSYLGFKNGGIFGLGLGESKQKLYFLPEAHTDFILSVVGEELGLLGVLLVVFGFAFVIWMGVGICMRVKSNYARYLAFGITSLIAIQASVNLGVAMGLLPTKGIPLPFISSGRSSLIVFLTCAAILNRVGLEGEHKEVGT